MPNFNPIRIWLRRTTSKLIVIAAVAIIYLSVKATLFAPASDGGATAERNEARLRLLRACYDRSLNCRLLDACYDRSLNCTCYGAMLSSSLGQEEIDALLSTGNLPESAAAKRAEAMHKCPYIPRGG
jgi:hypothetical protein